jgi:hypothetical protein
VQLVDDFWGINGVIPVDKKTTSCLAVILVVMFFLHVVINDPGYKIVYIYIHTHTHILPTVQNTQCFRVS